LLLITAEATAETPAGRTNYAAGIERGQRDCFIQLNSNFPAASLNNGDRKGANWGNGGGWADSASGTFPIGCR